MSISTLLEVFTWPDWVSQQEFWSTSFRCWALTESNRGCSSPRKSTLSSVETEMFEAHFSVKLASNLTSSLLLSPSQATPLLVRTTTSSQLVVIISNFRSSFDIHSCSRHSSHVIRSLKTKNVQNITKSKVNKAYQGSRIRQRRIKSLACSDTFSNSESGNSSAPLVILEYVSCFSLPPNGECPERST